MIAAELERPVGRWRERPHYGRLAELLAAVAVLLRGYRIVGRNVRVAGREVDLLAAAAARWWCAR